jgi:hypothetical protein
MKKVFLFLVIIFALAFCVSAQKDNDSKILILGFDENKPLEKDGLIIVIYPDSPEDYYLEPAYKGENQKRFLRRITRHENFSPSVNSRIIPKDSIEGKKIVVVDKNGEMPPMKPIYWVLIIFLGLLTILSPQIIKKLNRRERENGKR